MSEQNQIIKLADCKVGMPIQIVASGELLVVTDVNTKNEKETDLICKNLTTLISNNYPLSIVNRSGNMRKATEVKIREQAEKEIAVIRGAIAENRKIIEELEKQAEEKLSLIKAVRDYEQK